MFTLRQYLTTLADTHGLTRTLGEIEVCRDGKGRICYSAGNSAVVFRIRCEGRVRSLRCYMHHPRHLAEIYGEKLLPQELFIYTSPAGGVWVDVVLSDWIEGVTLHEAVAAAAETGDTARLRRFAAAFDRMAAALTADDWAHGDLKPENIVADNRGRLHLIDFDAMFLPAFAGRHSPELGTAAFQHPARTVRDFDASLDDYPAALIATVLHAAAHDPSLLVRYPAEGLVLDPSAVIEGRSEAYREMLDAFARRGDAVGYRTAQLLRSPVAKLPQAASLFAWRLRPPPPADDPPELAVDAGRWGFRSGGRFVIPPVWDNGFDFSEGLAAVEIAGRWHFIDTAGRVVLNCPPCDAVKPFRNGTAELRSGLRREKIAHPLKNSR